MFGSLKPNALMIRQLLLASGVTDPDVLAMASQLMDGGLQHPTLRSIPVPAHPGVKIVDATMESETADVFIRLISVPKTGTTKVTSPANFLAHEAQAV